MKPKTQKTRSLSHCVWALLILTAGSFGCSEDNLGPSVFINTQETQVSFTDVNACTPGIFYTRFYFTIPYETSSDSIEIEKILYSIKGKGAPAEGEKNSFDNDGTEISFDLCIRFNANTYIDVTTTLVSTDGLESKAATVRINKPSGAN